MKQRNDNKKINVFVFFINTSKYHSKIKNSCPTFGHLYTLHILNKINHHFLHAIPLQDILTFLYILEAYPWAALKYIILKPAFCGKSHKNECFPSKTIEPQSSKIDI